MQSGFTASESVKQYKLLNKWNKAFWSYGYFTAIGNIGEDAIKSIFMRYILKFLLQ